MTDDTVLARLAEIKTMATPDLKAQWRELFATEPPPYNRKFLERAVSPTASRNSPMAG